MELDDVRARLTGGAKPAGKPKRHDWFDGDDYPRPPAEAIYTMARLKLPRPRSRALHWVVVVTWHDNRECEVFVAEHEIVVEAGSDEWDAAWACGHCVPWAREAWKPEDGSPVEGVRPRSEQLKLPRANDR